MFSLEECVNKNCTLEVEGMQSQCVASANAWSKIILKVFIFFKTSLEDLT